MRACCLNSKGRISAEMEQYDDVEVEMLEAIALSEPYHPSYGAEFAANLSRLFGSLPQLRHKAKSISKTFERLSHLNEALEIYLDDLAGWRRPGPFWDSQGAPSQESIQSRLIAIRTSYLYESKHDAKADFESILQLDEETKAVPPHVVVNAYLNLAEIYFHAGDHKNAGKMADSATRAAECSYLRSHPTNFVHLLKAASFSILSNAGDKSRQYVDMAIEHLRASLGENNPCFALCIMTRGLLLPFFSRGTDFNVEQESLYRQSLAIFRKFYPETHSRVIVITVFLSELLIRTARFDEAEKMLHQAIVNAEKSLSAADLKFKATKLLAELRLKQGLNDQARVFIKKSEGFLEDQPYNSVESKMAAYITVGRLYIDGGFIEDGERVCRTNASIAAPLRTELTQAANLQLALCLMRAGKAEEANQLLSNASPQAKPGVPAVSKRNELVDMSRRAWALHSSKQFEESKELATRVVKDALAFMPEAEESLVIALGVLLEQAKFEDKPEEILRLIAVVADFKDSLRLQCIMPSFYLEAASAFAKQKSIRADALFEQALQAAEAIESLSPKIIDSCCFAYMNHCVGRQNDKAMQLCERLLKLRAASVGTESQEYAHALTSKVLLLLESDPGGADTYSEQALKIMDNLAIRQDPQLFLLLSLRAMVLKKLLRFDESEEIKKRMALLKAATEKLVEETQEA